jgi:hypothetical protein
MFRAAFGPRIAGLLAFAPFLVFACHRERDANQPDPYDESLMNPPSDSAVPASSASSDALVSALRSHEQNRGGAASAASAAPPPTEPDGLECHDDRGLCTGSRISEAGRLRLEGMADRERLHVVLKNVASQSDLDTLSSVPWLVTLTIEPSGKLDSLGVVAGLKQLRHLSLPATLLPLLARAGDLGHLETLSILRCEDNGGADLGALKGLVPLKSLSLGGARCAGVTDLAPLAPLVNLEDLDVSTTSVDRLDALKGMQKLHVLRAAWTRVGSIAPVAQLSQLVALDVAATNVRDFSPLRTMTGLHGLKVSGMRDLSVLSALKDLESLAIEPGQEPEHRSLDLSPLAGLTKLRRLDLSGTSARSLVPLAGLSGIENLDLRGVCVRDVRPLLGLLHLKALDFSRDALEPADRAALERAFPDAKLVESTPAVRCSD